MHFLPFRFWQSTARGARLRRTRREKFCEPLRLRRGCLEFLERRELLAVDVSFFLANDTGPSNTDGVTEDATIGYVIHADEESNLIQIYIDGNLVFDGWAVEGASGTFTPSNVVEGCGSTNYFWQNYIATAAWGGGYGSVSYCAPGLDVSFALLNDTGASNTDGLTDDATIAYSIAGSTEGGTLEIYLDGNTVFDGVVAGEAGGTFQPPNLYEGNNYVSLYWVAWDEPHSNVTGTGYATVSFTYSQTPILEVSGDGDFGYALIVLLSKSL